MSFISVIIPTYNRAHLLTESIDSVLNQTHEDFELLVVDDHSTDDTEVVVNKYNDPRIKYLFNERTKGAPGARNTGLFKAKGEWVQFLDSDDIILPNKIESQLLLINKNVALIAGDYKEIRNNEERIIRSEDDKWIALIRSKLGCTCSNLFNSKFLLDINGWDEKLKSSQEYDLMFRLLKTGCSIKMDHSINTHINIGVDSVSQSEDYQRRYEILKTRFDLREQIKLYLTDNGLFTEKRKLEFDKYIFDQLWFNRYKQPQFFKEMKDLNIDLPLFYKWQRIIKSKLRYHILNKFN